MVGGCTVFHTVSLLFHIIIMSETFRCNYMRHSYYFCFRLSNQKNLWQDIFIMILGISHRQLQKREQIISFHQPWATTEHKKSYTTCWHPRHPRQQLHTGATIHIKKWPHTVTAIHNYEGATLRDKLVHM